MYGGPLPDPMIYFDEATTSWPKAPGVAEAVNAAIMQPPVPLEGSEPGRYGVCWECRQRLAQLLGVPYAERVLLTDGATHAINIVLFGLSRYRCARVITSCAEHEAVLRPLHYLRDHKRLHLTIIGLDANGNPDRGGAVGGADGGPGRWAAVAVHVVEYRLGPRLEGRAW